MMLPEYEELNTEPKPGPRKQGEGLGQTDKAKEKAKASEAAETATPSRKSPNTLVSRAIAYAAQNPVVTNDPKYWFQIGYKDAEKAHLTFHLVDEDCGYERDIKNLDAYHAGIEDYKEQCAAKVRRDH